MNLREGKGRLQGRAGGKRGRKRWNYILIPKDENGFEQNKKSSRLVPCWEGVLVASGCHWASLGQV